MKKLTVLIVITLAMITALGSVCGAEDKKGYVVKETFKLTFDPSPNSDDNEGRVYCADNDFVTGCSYSLESIPGGTRPSDYAFHHMIPIGCDPSLIDEDAGVAVCKGCLVALTVPPSPGSTAEGTFRVYAYCGRGKK